MVLMGAILKAVALEMWSLGCVVLKEAVLRWMWSLGVYVWRHTPLSQY